MRAMPRLGVLLALLLAAENASAAGTPRAGADLVAAAVKARKAAAAERERAAKLLVQIQELAAQKKQVATSIASTKSALGPHLTAGKAALKSYDAATKAGKNGPAEAALLEKSQRELAVADAGYAELIKQTASLRALEESLLQKQDELRRAAAAAQASLAEANASVTELDARAKSTGDAIQGAWTAADSAARSLLAKAGVAPKGYSAARAKADAEDKKLAEALANVEKAAKSAAAPPKPPAPKQCDLRKMDWSRFYPSTSETTEDGTNEFAVQDATYVDLDGDGTVEAIVFAVYSHLGMTASQVFFWNVVRRDSECSVIEVETLKGSICASVEMRGKVIVFDNRCGEESAIVEYQLVGGKLKETKRRAQ